MKSQRHLSLATHESPHGTRACYVRMKCRCDKCKAANNGWARERNKRKIEMARDIRPSGPPIDGMIMRGGKEYKVKLCPGAEGKKCVVSPAKWLRTGGAFCIKCAERVTVWNGLVNVTRKLTNHVAKLRAEGIGYRSIAHASSTSRTTIQGIAAGTVTRLRAETVRRIMSVTKDALGAGHLVDAAEGVDLINKLLASGLTKREVSERIGYTSGSLGTTGKRARMSMKTVHALRRAWRVRAEEVKAERRAKVAPTREREVPDLVPSNWLDEDGMPLPQFRERVARMRAGRKAA